MERGTIGIEDVTTDGFAEKVVFLNFFNDLPDSRQSGKVKYQLSEILLLCLLAVLAGADCITDIDRFGQKKRELLRRFRPFVNGTTTSATAWRRSTLWRSNAVSCPGRRRSQGSISM